MSRHVGINPLLTCQSEEAAMTRSFIRPMFLSVPLAAFCCLAVGACAPDVTGASSSALTVRPSLGTAGSFAVLANAAVTCTDATITGNVGTQLAAPVGSFTQTICPVAGAIDVGDSSASQAYSDFLHAYDAVASQPCDAYLTGTLSGVTLRPGVYCFDATAALTGTLTLDGPSTGTWLFKVGTSGTGALTGNNFSVVMAGGADPCNVTWWVADAATLTDSNFIGTILAGSAITDTRGTFDGRALSKADVTITGTAMTGCTGGSIGGSGHAACNQGVGNGPEGCDPGNSNHHNATNDEDGGLPGAPGRRR